MIRYIDGFDYLEGTSTDRLSAAGWFPLYNGSGHRWPQSAPGRFGSGLCIGWYGLGAGGGNGLMDVFHPVGSYMTQGVFGCAVLIPDTSTTEAFISMYDSSLGFQFSVSFLPGGVVQVSRGYYNTAVLGSSLGGSFNLNAWFYVECKFNIAAVGGSVEVLINTVPVVTVPSANTLALGTNGADAIYLGSTQSGGSTITSYYFDDLYVLDPTGSINNDYLGNQRVHTQFPASNGSHLDWTIGGSSPAATNWQSVLDSNLDDAQFVQSATAGNYDLYHFDATLLAPTVACVQVRGAYRQDDATQKSVKNQVSSGGTLASGVAHYTNQSYTYFHDVFELDPHTSAAWLYTNVNLLQAGPLVNT